ncbi:MAG: hypothetical protein HOL84_09045 [Nitrospina sp.]|nr:hypothetical protein [Nitrospina sp.]
MKTRISLGFLFVSVLYVGVFGVLPAWGDDLKVTLENEVAGITPDMKILASEQGRLLGNGSPGMVAAASGYYQKEGSTAESSYFSPSKKSAAEKKYANAGFITSDLAPVGTVIKLFEQKLGTSGPDEFFVDIGRRQGIEKGDRFTVYSLDRFIYHPVLPGRGEEKLEEYTRRNGYKSRDLKVHPGKPVGHRVLVHGVIVITQPGDEFSYARVVQSYESIEPGHLLTPYKKFEDQTSAFSQTDKSIEGYIVASKGDKIGILYDDFIYIDKGWEDDVRPGDRFEVYSIPYIMEEPVIAEGDNVWDKLEPKKIPLLPSMLGEIKVIATQKKTATAIVVKSKIDMEIGHSIRFKRSHHPG